MHFSSVVHWRLCPFAFFIFVEFDDICDKLIPYLQVILLQQRIHISDEIIMREIGEGANGEGTESWEGGFGIWDDGRKDYGFV